MKTELSDVKERLGGIEHRLGNIETTLHNVFTEQVRARGDIEWLKNNVVTRDEFKSGLHQILNRIDGLAAKIEDAPKAGV